MTDTCIPMAESISLQDRVAILEDLVEFHADREIQAAHEIFRIVADLQSVSMSGQSVRDLEISLVRASMQLTLLARELAIKSLNVDATGSGANRRGGSVKVVSPTNW